MREHRPVTTGRIIAASTDRAGPTPLRWAADEADIRDAELVALMAWGYLDQHPVPGHEGFDPSYGQADAEEAATQYVARALGPQHRPVTVQDGVRSPGAGASSAAAGADLLVMGARGVGGFRGLPRRVGDATSSERDHRPAGARPSTKHLGDPSGPLVVGVDGSDNAAAAFRWAHAEADAEAPTSRRCTHGRADGRWRIVRARRRRRRSKRRRWTRWRRPDDDGRAGPRSRGASRAARTSRTCPHRGVGVGRHGRRGPPWTPSLGPRRSRLGGAAGRPPQPLPGRRRADSGLTRGWRTPRDPYRRPHGQDGDRRRLRADGAVCVRAAFGPDDVELARRAIEANLGSPSPYAKRPAPTTTARSSRTSAAGNDFPRWRRSSGLARRLHRRAADGHRGGPALPRPRPGQGARHPPADAMAPGPLLQRRRAPERQHVVPCGSGDEGCHSSSSPAPTSDRGTCHGRSWTAAALVPRWFAGGAAGHRRRPAAIPSHRMAGTGRRRVLPHAHLHTAAWTGQDDGAPCRCGSWAMTWCTHPGRGPPHRRSPAWSGAGPGALLDPLFPVLAGGATNP